MLKVVSESQLMDQHIKIMSPLSESHVSPSFWPGVGGWGRKAGDGQGASLGSEDRGQSFFSNTVLIC